MTTPFARMKRVGLLRRETEAELKLKTGSNSSRENWKIPGKIYVG